MEVWKIVFHFILEIFHSIPFWHLPYRYFRSIPFSIPFHALGCRFYIIIVIIIIVTFHPNGCSQGENPEAPDFGKIASASGSFSTLSLPSSLPTSFIKVLPLPWKLTASTSSFRFHIPDYQSFLSNLFSLAPPIIFLYKLYTKYITLCEFYWTIRFYNLPASKQENILPLAISI